MWAIRGVSSCHCKGALIGQWAGQWVPNYHPLCMQGQGQGLLPNISGLGAGSGPGSRAMNPYHELGARPGTDKSTPGKVHPAVLLLATLIQGIQRTVRARARAMFVR